MKEAVEAVLVVVMVVAMSGWARVAHVNKMEPQRPDSHRQFIVYHSNRYFAVREFMHECTLAGSFPCIRSDAVLVNSVSQKLGLLSVFCTSYLFCVLFNSDVFCVIMQIDLCFALPRTTYLL